MKQWHFDKPLTPPHGKSAKSMLVFSIALNGYQWLYRHHLASHARYAKRLGAHYVLVDRPIFTRMGTECCWLKLLLLKQALLKGYDSVLFLDADALVWDTAPDIRQNYRPDHHIYMAKGKTQRFNSGVMLLRNHHQSLAFINDILCRRHQPVPSDCDVGWGENGHVIQVAKQFSCVGELGLIWNNTWQPKLQDHIRHFNFGIMRNQQSQGRWLNFTHWCLARLTFLVNTAPLHKRFGKNTVKPPKIDDLSTDTSQANLDHLLTLTRQMYPQYF